MRAKRWPIVISFLAGFTASTWLAFAVLEIR